MKISVLVVLSISLYYAGIISAENQPEDSNPLQISQFAESLSKTGKRILQETDWINWCMAPVYDDEMKVHLYYCRWPRTGSWTRNGQIAYATSDKPDGSYKFQSVLFGDDQHSYYNPQIKKVGDTYVMVYTCVVFDKKKRNKKHGSRQIKLATATSPAGPWTTSPHIPLLLATNMDEQSQIRGACNPTFVMTPDGQCRIYFKSAGDGRLVIGLATSDKIVGPYHLHKKNPVLDYSHLNVDVEDPYVFYYKGKYYMIVEDRMDVASAISTGKPPENPVLGGVRPGLIYESSDGIQWQRPEIGYRQNTFYFGGKVNRMERPHILWKGEKPDYIFFALSGPGIEIQTGCGAVLKIGDW